LSEIREARLQKANSLLSKGFSSYAESFKVSHTTKYLIQKFDYLENGQEEEFSVSIAGRVMARRVMGKIAFFTISDQEGQIQLYLDKGTINCHLENQKLLSYEDIKEIVDIGDWIGVYGTIKKTNNALKKPRVLKKILKNNIFFKIS